MKKFQAGTPACPNACRYCFVTEHDRRREVWNAKPVAGINKACTFINVTPWIADDTLEQERFHDFPWDILAGDFVGFTAITDPFWPKLQPFLEEFLERGSSVAKLLTCVTKWPISRQQMRMVSRFPNFFLVVGITGNESIEKFPVRKHLETLALAKEFGVPTLPICHPYISGVSELSFLSELKQLGYDEFDVKGFRYCDARMGSWMPDASKPLYAGREEDEILPEDGWRKRVADAGLRLLSPRQWYLREGVARTPHLPQRQAERLVSRVMELANTVSSDKDGVFEAAVQRRL